VLICIFTGVAIGYYLATAPMVNAQQAMTKLWFFSALPAAALAGALPLHGKWADLQKHEMLNRREQERLEAIIRYKNRWLWAAQVYLVISLAVIATLAAFGGALDIVHGLVLAGGIIGSWISIALLIYRAFEGARRALSEFDNRAARRRDIDKDRARSGR